MTVAREPSAAFRPGAGTASMTTGAKILISVRSLPGFAKQIVPRRPILGHSLPGPAHFSAEVIIGVAELPQDDFPPANFDRLPGAKELLSPWRDACRCQYKETHDNSASRGYLEPRPLSMPRGYGLLADLTGIANSRLTLHLLKRLRESAFQKQVRFGHSTTAAYPKIEVPHPLPWYLLSKGTFQCGSATAPLAAIVSRQSETELSRVPEWDRLSSAFEQLNAAFPSVESSARNLRTLWLAVMSALVTEDALAKDALTELWVGAANDGIVPVALPGSSGKVPISDVFVTTSIDLARRARINGRVVVALDGPTMQSWVEAGAQDLSDLIKTSWADSAGPPERLITVFPELHDAFTRDRPGHSAMSECGRAPDAHRRNYPARAVRDVGRRAANRRCAAGIPRARWTLARAAGRNFGGGLARWISRRSVTAPRGFAGRRTTGARRGRAKHLRNACCAPLAIELNHCVRRWETR